MRSVGASSGCIERLERLANLLLSEALPRGLLGPSEADRILDRHILESAALAPILGRDLGTRIVDVGSGAGLPGLVLSCFDVGSLTLVESDRRRAAFLEEAAKRLDLEVSVDGRRAEAAGRDLALRDSAAAAVARALAPPAVALELTMPFVRPGGIVALLVGSTARPEYAATAALELGGDLPVIEEREVPGSRMTCRVMIVAKQAVTPDRYPRRNGVPARRPLTAGG